MRRFVAAVVVALLVAGCGESASEPTVLVDRRAPGADSPELAVSAVLRAIPANDRAVLDAMTLTDQWGLVSLVEGASTAEAEAALGFASEQVAATFWNSFAEGVEGFIGADIDDMRIGQIESVDVAGARFATVAVEFPLDPADRVFVVTDRDGWRIDLVASFPGAFVASVPFAIERATAPGAGEELAASIAAQRPSLEALQSIGVREDLESALEAALAAVDTLR